MRTGFEASPENELYDVMIVIELAGPGNRTLVSTSGVMHVVEASRAEIPSERVSIASRSMVEPNAKIQDFSAFFFKLFQFSSPLTDSTMPVSHGQDLHEASVIPSPCNCTCRSRKASAIC